LTKLQLLLKKKLFSLLPDFLKRQLKRAYYYKKFSEAKWDQEPELALLKSMVSPGQTVLDVGANYGLYTRFLAALVGENGRVVSLEPVPETYDIVAHNVKTYRLTQAEVLPLAASDQEGQAVVFIPTWEDGSDNFYEASLSASSATAQGRSISIQTIKLDTLCQDFERLDFIKLDVEGHEPEALAGAKQVIQRFRPSMLVEINDDFEKGSTGDKVLTFMQGLQYRMYVLQNGTLCPAQGKGEGVNYWFFPVEKETH
jgi:FkbM family methyltransferase